MKGQREEVLEFGFSARKERMKAMEALTNQCHSSLIVARFGVI